MFIRKKSDELLFFYCGHLAISKISTQKDIVGRNISDFLQSAFLDPKYIV